MKYFRDIKRTLTNDEIDANFRKILNNIPKYPLIAFVDERYGSDINGIIGMNNSPFKSISSALNAINDASENKKYTIVVNPGYYEEQIYLKPFINIHFKQSSTLKGGFIIYDNDSNLNTEYTMSGFVDITSNKLLSATSVSSFIINMDINNFQTEDTSNDSIIDITCPDVYKSNINITATLISESHSTNTTAMNINGNMNFNLNCKSRLNLTGSISLNLKDSSVMFESPKITINNKSIGTHDIPLFDINSLSSEIMIKADLSSTQYINSTNSGLFNIRGLDNIIRYEGDIYSNTSIINMNSDSKIIIQKSKIHMHINTDAIGVYDTSLIKVNDLGEIFILDSYIKLDSSGSLSHEELCIYDLTLDDESTPHLTIDNSIIMLMYTETPLLCNVTYNNTPLNNYECVIINNSLITSSVTPTSSYLLTNNTVVDFKIQTYNIYTNLVTSVPSGFQMLFTGICDYIHESVTAVDLQI